MRLLPCNQHAEQNKNPLPRIYDLLYKLRNAIYFLSLDLASELWQIPFVEEDRAKDGF